MCKYLIEQFLGKIKVQSKLNYGSKFTFTMMAQEVSDISISSSVSN